MLHMSTRKIQATNLFFSSWGLVFLTVGVVVEEWVNLKLDTQKFISHSPWICCTALWPEDKLEVVRIMMILVLNLSFLHNLFLGLEFTYMIPQMKYILFIPVILGFLTGSLLFFALLLYHQKLRQGQAVYYSSYKITWITFIAYLNVFCFISSGFLSLLSQSHSCSCLNIIRLCPIKHLDAQPSEIAVKPVSLPERTAMPRSIVRSHCREDSLNKPHSQTRRVTWAL
ncbi:PREDICTED: transmembrane protein 225 [Condylura cristata]|uniref:transmembrane protein 225 n=1 Tax=Condylura cristata TaxID=143302 RepID=UPI0003347A00|nr:PREDICTED: transmembrane protein 225 [Condylura cristata]